MRINRNKPPMSKELRLEALECFREFLRTQKLRMTEVRQSIVEAALDRRDHFRVEDLVGDLKSQGQPISAATVYRALPLLLESGIVEATEVSGDIRYYELSYGQEHHDHLICSHCKTVVEFQFEAFAMLEKEVAAQFGYELTGHYHELIGVCAKCRDNLPNSS